MVGGTKKEDSLAMRHIALGIDHGEEDSKMKEALM